jgi:hypothetical protein
MSDDGTEGIGVFDPDNPTAWGVILSSYDLASFVLAAPLALHIFHKDGKRTLVTGVLTSTEDTYATAQSPRPTESLFYMKNADILTIDWSKVGIVMAQVAVVVEDGPGGQAGE